MNITVYAASSGQVPVVYQEAAYQLGTLLADRGHILINGAGRTGLMGATTEGAHLHGGRTIGIIPRFMVEQGWQHNGMGELVITDNMHSRKEKMAELSDACIACPGGVGTLEELLEVITWKQLGLYLKPIVILNTHEYFSPLLCQLKRSVEQHFMRSIHAGIWQVADTPEEAVKMCEDTPLWEAGIRKFAAL